MGHLLKWGIGFIALSAGLTGCHDTSHAPDTVIADKPVERLAPAEIVRVPTKNAYFGDLHVHTRNSFDAYILDTRVTPDQAYRFAKGEAIPTREDKMVQLDGPPLDFYAVTDHGEYMGIVEAMRDRDNPLSKTATAKSIFGITAQNRRENFLTFGRTIVTGDEMTDVYDRDFIDSVWAKTKAITEAHNDPGRFTTFHGYEFTAMQMVGDDLETAVAALNLHRNVIFESNAPDRLFTTLVSPSPEDLWDWMAEQREAGMDVLSIPHNSNASNGQMFALTDYEGQPLTVEAAQARMAAEPLVEISQLKGTSETHPALSPEDEWSDHELYTTLIGSDEPSDPLAGSFVRQALARGQAIEAVLGVNPFEFGVIASSDTHIGAPSLNEETHFGKFADDIDLSVRASIPKNGRKQWTEADRQTRDIVAAPQYGASGLAGVWAEANTREDLFAGMRAKETFGTSGPRLKVRFFAGDYTPDILTRETMIEDAYAGGQAMGGRVSGNPDFLIWAMQDPNGAPLERVQIIKSWADASGTLQEDVIDVACADGSTPKDGRCDLVQSDFDYSTCQPVDAGAADLKAVWRDPNPVPHAAYYVRALEVRKCRWSSWDAMRNGTPPSPEMKPLVQDRAWSSPIWVRQD